ncbi:MAG: tail fiber domain-containing protein, partial [Verrucomicrobiales bacterium]|nr:tail fiber domain-containing protein [Verrucomicrobiales bacterium]
LNTATNYAFAAGRRAKANHTGAFVWADAQNADFVSTATNTFNIRASGGVRLSHDTYLDFGSQTRQMINLWGGVYGIGVQTSTHYFRTGGHTNDGFAWYQGGTHSDTALDPGTGGTLLARLDRSYLTVRGAGNEQLYIGGNGADSDIEIGSRNTNILNVSFWNPVANQFMKLYAQSFNTSSDRAAKEDFRPVDVGAILEKVVALPVTEWSFRGQAGTRHLGPTAQDFHAAFGLGTDDKTIATVDADGVALAAIQGLNAKVESGKQKAEKDLAELRAENAALKARLERLEALLTSPAGAADGPTP